MNTLGYKLLEDCLDGTFIYEVQLPGPISRNSILNLAQIGKLNFYPHFPRPFFKVYTSGEFEMKGIEGESYIRVLLYTEMNDRFIEMLHRIFPDHIV